MSKNTVSRAERRVTELIHLDGITLRLDKVVRWLTARLRTTLSATLPEFEVVVITVTAPILQPTKTAAAIETIAIGLRTNSRRFKTVHGNKIGIRRLQGGKRRRSEVCVFVHNRASDAAHILTLAEQVFTARGP